MTDRSEIVRLTQDLELARRAAERHRREVAGLRQKLELAREALREIMPFIEEDVVLGVTNAYATAYRHAKQALAAEPQQPEQEGTEE